MTETETKTVNVGIFGDQNVGKSALAGRFIDKKFPKTTPSTYLNMPTGTADVYGTKVSFSIYDVPGAVEHQSLAMGVYAGIEVALLCFDVTNEDSFNGLSKWISQIDSNLPVNGVKIIVGLKTDMERKVQTENARNFATNQNYMYLEASAKSSQKQVNEIFCVGAAKALGIAIPPPPEPKSKGSCCCFM